MRIDTVYDLRRYIEPFTDECPVRGLNLEYSTDKHGGLLATKRAEPALHNKQHSNGDEPAEITQSRIALGIYNSNGHERGCGCEVCGGAG